jgi:hypothetical protein
MSVDVRKIDRGERTSPPSLDDAGSPFERGRRRPREVVAVFDAW